MSRAPHLSEFAARLAALGAKPSHVRRIFRAWMGLCPWEAKASLHFPQPVEEALPALRRELEGLSRALYVPSAATRGSAKLIVELSDGECVESVLLSRQGLCVSTQVGCAVGCLFCQTGRGGLIRQLSSAEIIAQVREAMKLRPGGVKKVVFMGMGEPSHNAAAVCEAVEFLGDIAGLAHKDIVVSTVGDPKFIRRLGALRVKPALALSLHTTDDALRRKLLPKSPAVPAAELLRIAQDYACETKYPVQIEWTLIKGVNDSIEEARRLESMLEPERAMVNYIAVNPIEGRPFERPEGAHMQSLITVQRRSGKNIVATVRESAAQDVEGGCGQLRARVLRNRRIGTER